MEFKEAEVVINLRAMNLIVKPGAILPNDIDSKFLQFLWDLLEAGLVGESTISVGMALSLTFELAYTLTTKANLGPLVDLIFSEDGNFTYGFPNGVVPKASPVEKQYVLISHDGKFAIMPKSAMFNKNCSLNKPIAKPVWADIKPNLAPVVKSVSEPIAPKPAVNPLAQSIYNALILGKIRFEIVFVTKGIERVKVVILSSWERFEFKEQTCDKSPCIDPFCFYSGHIADHYKVDKESLCSKNPELRTFINGVIRSYDLFLQASDCDDDEEYDIMLDKSTKILAGAIASIPAYHGGKKSIGHYLKDSF